MKLDEWEKYGYPPIDLNLYYGEVKELLKIKEKFKTILDTVSEVRKNQKYYFKTRDRDALLRSKEAERKLDSLIKEETNPKLF